MRIICSSEDNSILAHVQIVCKYVGVQKEDHKLQLRGANLRATPARLALLSTLAEERKPLAVSEITKAMGLDIDQATIYRVLGRLVEAGLIKRLAIKSGISHFELADRPHHHHLICEQCGLVEDVTVCCDDPKPVAVSFSKVTSHTLEYAGICEACAA